MLENTLLSNPFLQNFPKDVAGACRWNFGKYAKPLVDRVVNGGPGRTAALRMLSSALEVPASTTAAGLTEQNILAALKPHASQLENLADFHEDALEDVSTRRRTLVNLTRRILALDAAVKTRVIFGEDGGDVQNTLADAIGRVICPNPDPDSDGGEIGAAQREALSLLPYPGGARRRASHSRARLQIPATPRPPGAAALPAALPPHHRALRRGAGGQRGRGAEEAGPDALRGERPAGACDGVVCSEDRRCEPAVLGREGRGCELAAPGRGGGPGVRMDLSDVMPRVMASSRFGPTTSAHGRTEKTSSGSWIPLSIGGRSPILKPDTPAPTASISPHISPPGVNGIGIG